MTRRDTADRNRLHRGDKRRHDDHRRDTISLILIAARVSSRLPRYREFIGRTIRRFMEQYAEAAATRGWTAIDLFGVHPRVGAVRVDCCGALMLPTTSAVTAISPSEMTFGPVVYRKRPMPESVLVWEFDPVAGMMREAAGR